MSKPQGDLIAKVRFFIPAFDDKPSAWAGYRSQGTGRRKFVTPKEQTVRQEIMLACRAELKRLNLEHLPTLDCVVVLRVGVFWRRPKKWWPGMEPTTRPDATNYLKLFEDALNKYAWKDDSIIVDPSCRKVYWDYPGYLGLIWYYEKVPRPVKERALKK